MDIKLEQFLKEWIDTHSTKPVEWTPLHTEWYRILYRIGVITNIPGLDLQEPINYKVIREATYGRFKRYLG